MQKTNKRENAEQRNKESAEKAKEEQSIRLAQKSGMIESKNLDKIAFGYAIAWFSSHDCQVTIPISLTPYDLIIEENGKLLKIQIKSVRALRKGKWAVKLNHRVNDRTSSYKRRVVAYTKEQIDFFFILTACLEIYLIPIEAVLGKQTLILDNHPDFKKENALVHARRRSW